MALSEIPGPPGLQLVVGDLDNAAEGRRRQSPDAVFLQNAFHGACGNALEVHRGEGETDGVAGAYALFQRLRVEGPALFVGGGFGHADGDGSGRGADALRLAAVGVSPSVFAFLVVLGYERLTALCLHRLVEEVDEDFGHGVGTFLDEQLHEVGVGVVSCRFLPVSLDVGSLRGSRKWPRRVFRVPEQPGRTSSWYAGLSSILGLGGWLRDPFYREGLPLAGATVWRTKARDLLRDWLVFGRHGTGKRSSNLPRRADFYKEYSVTQPQPLQGTKA